MSQAPKKGGWKPSQDLLWKIVKGTPHASNITIIWRVPYESMRLHDRNSFTERTATVAEDRKEEVKKVYDYLAKVTPKTRGGNATSSLSGDQRSEAAYIWKVLKKQSYEIEHSKQSTLNIDNTILELQKLIDELNQNVAPCTWAREQARRGKGRAADSEVSETEEVEVEEPDEAESPFAEALSRLNRGSELSQVAPEPWMDNALSRLHKAVGERASQGPETSIHELKYPTPLASGGAAVGEVVYQTPTLASLESQVKRFSKAETQSAANPFTGLQIGQGRGSIEGSGQKASKRKGDTGAAPKDLEKSPSAKRVRSSEVLGLMENKSAHAVAEGVDTADWDSIRSQCTTVWDSCTVMQGAIYLGTPARKELRHAILTGMYGTAQLVEELKDSQDPDVLSFVRTITELDSIAPKL